jgi:hypothetical protein
MKSTKGRRKVKVAGTGNGADAPHTDVAQIKMLRQVPHGENTTAVAGEPYIYLLNGSYVVNIHIPAAQLSKSYAPSKYGRGKAGHTAALEDARLMRDMLVYVRDEAHIQIARRKLRAKTGKLRAAARVAKRAVRRAVAR